MKSHTRIVIELASTNDINAAFLLGIARVLIEHCPDLRCVIIPRRQYTIENGCRATLMSAARNASSELTQNRRAERCVYVAPRQFTFKLPEGPLAVDTMVMAVANKERVTDVQTRPWDAEHVPADVMYTLDVETEATRAEVVTRRVSPPEAKTLMRLKYAVQGGYDIAMADLGTCSMQ